MGSRSLTISILPEFGDARAFLPQSGFVVFQRAKFGGNMSEDNYPDYLKTDDFNASHFNFLLPHVLENGKMYKRRDCLRQLVEYHEMISGLRVSQSIEKIGNRLKKLFNNKDNFKSAEGVLGGWIYVGPSYEQQSLTDKAGIGNSHNERREQSDTPLYIIKKTIDATNKGDETLYVWWHPDSEKLAAFENKKDWAMKVGIHHEKNVEHRIEDYKVSIPYKPIFGLLVHCRKASILEKTIHRTLNNRGKNIREMGTEWFVTSIKEIEEILKFNHLI